MAENIFNPVLITELPSASTITGNEPVAVVQGGQTVQTVVSALLAGYEQAFVIFGSGAPLPNFRTLAAGSGITIQDNGAGSDLIISASSSGVAWGDISGTLSSQTDLQTALNAKQNTITTGTTAQYLRGNLTLATFPTEVSSFTNDSGYITSSALTPYTPTSRTITINGVTQDLSANRSWTISTGVAWGDISGTLSSQTDLQTALNAKQNSLTLTTTGTSGAATLVGSTLNIPQYSSGGGSGTVTSVSISSANGFSGSVANATTTPAITLSTSVTGLIKGNGTAISAATAGTDYADSSFKTISVSGQSDVVADSASDTLTLVAGSNITITTNASTDTITIAASGSGSGISDVIIFGNGQDGAYTASSGTTTLTRDMYYSSMTPSGTAKIVTNGYRVFCSGNCDLTNAGADFLATTVTGGNAGVTASTAAVSPGTANNSVSVGADRSSGGSSGGGGTAAGASPAGFTTTSPMCGGIAGVGGNGGAGSGGAGGTGGTAGTPIAFPIYNFSSDLSAGATLIAGGAVGQGGGGGGGDGTAGGSGAGGARGGGVVALFAKTLTRAGTTAASAISAKGGNGAAGGASTAGNRGGGGGSGGGGGGWVYIIYGTLAGSTATNCIDVSGGAGGNGGNGFGTGVGGAGGGSGGGGRVTLCNLTTGVISETAPTSGTAGGAASGTTGGTGASATTVRVNL